MEKESMEYLLIDFENVSSASFSGLPENQKVLIFAGENQSKVRMEMVRSTQPLGKGVEWIVICGNGKNAVDFHIAFYIGRLSALDPTAKFKIFSKDKGFDPLIRHLSSNNIQCNRIEEIPEIASGHGIHEFLSVVVEHLMRMDEKRRPGKEARLKAWVKDRIRKEDSIVEQVLKGLISGNHILVREGKIQYP